MAVVPGILLRNTGCPCSALMESGRGFVDPRIESRPVDAAFPWASVHGGGMSGRIGFDATANGWPIRRFRRK